MSVACEGHGEGAPASGSGGAAAAALGKAAKRIVRSCYVYHSGWRGTDGNQTAEHGWTVGRQITRVMSNLTCYLCVSHGRSPCEKTCS